ncbi:TonB-dependent receptor [Lacinutrix salivirga]
MFNKRNQCIVLCLVLITTVIFAQEREQDTIKTDVINVIKPYEPTISDAFKVKETPNLNDEETTTKKEIHYNIFSFPVASTFTPAKGKAAVVDKAEKVKLYNHYATLGVGTYTTVLGEVYLNHEISNNENIGAYVSHHSSGGGIEDVLLNDDFIDSKINLNYSKKLRDLSWNAEGGFAFQKFNWYGLPQATFDQTTADTLNVAHNFTTAHIGGDVKFEDGVVNAAEILFRRFGDNQNSGENRFKAKGVFTVPVLEEGVKTALSLDYLGGSFDRNYSTTDAINYGNFIVGLSPSFQLTQEDLTVDLGFTVNYLNNTEASESKLYIYPNFNASYRLVDDVLIAFGGVTGELIQNSYYDFAQLNPFVSPTLFIIPTDQQYNAFAGLKGKLSNTMSYAVNARYVSEKNKALYQNNLVPYGFNASEDYQYGNSFGLVYDNVTTLSFAGELSVDMNRNFTLGVKVEYFAYNTDSQAEAWNLPEIKGSLFMDYQINDQWFTGANLFYVGERKDLAGFNDIGNPAFPSFLNPTSVVTLESYFDANAHVGYHINDRFSVFVKANNIIGENYEKWQNTPVQGIQFLAGATYKFDF